MLPKDYVRLRLTGEWATDVADASGTLLLDVARRTWSAEVLDALELPRAWLPPVLESPAVAGVTIACDDLAQGVPVAAGAGDCAAAALGVGIDRPGPLSIVLGTSGVVFAALPSFRVRAAGPRARLLPCRAGRLACDGSDVVGSRVAAVVSRPACARRAVRRARRRGRCLGAGRRGPAVPALSRGREDPARRSRRESRVRRASSCDTTAARWCGPCSRASRSACATRSSCCASWVSRQSRHASRAAAHARLPGCGSSPPSSDCRSRRPRPRRDLPSAPRCSAALPEGCSPTCTTRSRACVRVGATIEPDASRVAAYDQLYERFRALYPALRRTEET